jgi:hypothetical protein
MAELNKIPAEHRSVASRMPHLERMSAEEARHRAAHVARLEERAPMTGEGRTLAMGHAQRLLDAIPVREYLDQLQTYHEMADAMPNQARPGELFGPASEMRTAGNEFKQKHIYVPGLVDACNRRLLGKEPEYDCDIDAVLGIGQAEKATAGRRNATSLEKAVNIATADLDDRIANLRKAIDAEKARIAKAYADANQPLPRGFLPSPSQHPDAGKLRELEAEAEKFRDMANSVSEHDLRAHYRAEAEDYEDRAAKLRAAMERSISV